MAGTDKIIDRLNGSVRVVIPSYKRADKLIGKDYFTYAVYCVPESQREEYEAVVGKKRVVTLPDESDGSIPRKRNWILNNFERPLVMIDDDVKCLTHSERGRQQIPLSIEQTEALIIHGFNLANEFGAKLWGLNVNTDGRNYQQYRPFSLTQVVLGPFQGHLEHALAFDDRMDTKDDYDMSLQHLQVFKKVLRLNKYAYNCGHGTNSGGIVSHRTLGREEAACTAIMKKWGKSVISYKTGGKTRKMGDLLNGKVNIPIKGV